ncbi:MAG: putative amino acid transporter [Mycobacterium sp.]|nr:putative amino acid transporter [Mycobacterium sp.]
MMRTTSRRVGILAVAAALVLTAAGCAKKDTGATSASGVKLVKAGQLTVCTHLPYAPFQFEAADRKVVGFDVDLMDLVAKKLGVTQSIVNTPFEGIKSGQDLKTGKCDVAAAGMTITPTRKQVIDFSDPYFDATQALLVKKGAPYTSLADLRGKRVGGQSATTGLDYLKANAKANGYEIVDFEDLAAEQQALATDQIAAAVNDLPVWSEYLKENQGKFEISTQFHTGEQYGFGLEKGANPELLKLVNDTIAQAKKDGTYAALYKKWIGAQPTQ